MHSFIYISCLVKKYVTIYYCFCMKCITLCIGICCSPSSNYFASLIQNIPEFEAKKYFIDHQTANAIQLFVPIKRTFFGSLLFQNKLQQRGIPQKLLEKYSHLFICTSLIKMDIKWWTKTCLHCQNHNIRMNSLCYSALLWTSFCFLQVDQ